MKIVNVIEKWGEFRQNKENSEVSGGDGEVKNGLLQKNVEWALKNSRKFSSDPSGYRFST